ncbi:MAG: hypothetical protein IID05_04220 [Gemmatimonadetes bacterium]|nr:hypothetical protein [Gemmatimonadota bacterium]
MKTKKLLLPMFGLGLALAVAQPAAAGTEVSVAADTVQADVVTVKVENQNWLDMRIYAIVGGFAHRLGTVGSFGSEEFTLRKGWIGPSDVIRMVAVPIGSRAVNYAQEVLVVPGDYVEYRIENSLALSFVAKY